MTRDQMNGDIGENPAYEYTAAWSRYEETSSKHELEVTLDREVAVPCLRQVQGSKLNLEKGKWRGKQLHVGDFLDSPRGNFAKYGTK
jgi:hypothetical protein